MIMYETIRVLVPEGGDEYKLIEKLGNDGWLLVIRLNDWLYFQREKQDESNQS